jgi:protein phosphatase
MGGHERGEVASRLAVDLLGEYAARHVPRLRPSSRRTFSQLRPLAERLVGEWTRHVNEAIYQRGGGDEGKARTRMGTTLALLLAVEDFSLVAHVGDSRVYRFRERAIELLTADHSIVAPDRDSERRRQRKYVTRALGTKPTVEPEIRIETLQAGDVFLLCSDGLSDTVRGAEMRMIVERAGEDRSKALRSLIHLANRRGGPDNITVVLGEAHAEQEEEEDETEELDLGGLRHGSCS